MQLLGVLPRARGGRHPLGPPAGVGIRRRGRVDRGRPGRRSGACTATSPSPPNWWSGPAGWTTAGSPTWSPTASALTSVYNRYSFVDTDPAYHPEREAQHLLLWPLFVTSFVVDDFLGDHDMFGATTRGGLQRLGQDGRSAAPSSCRAHRGRGGRASTSAGQSRIRRRPGLLRPGLPYDELDALDPRRRSCYMDVAGRRDVTAAVHAHLGDHLRYSMVVGDTHWDAPPADPPVPGRTRHRSSSSLRTRSPNGVGGVGPGRLRAAPWPKPGTGSSRGPTGGSPSAAVGVGPAWRRPTATSSRGGSTPGPGTCAPSRPAPGR